MGKKLWVSHDSEVQPTHTHTARRQALEAEYYTSHRLRALFLLQLTGYMT
jgi:hypothetical protein